MSFRIKVMSSNLRTEVERDGINAFSNRKDFTAEVLLKADADIIGFQEVKPHMHRWVEETFGDKYVVIGVGREEKFVGERMTIAFKKEKFELFSMENFWLSTDACAPGSTYGGDQSHCPRMCTVVGLIERESATLFRFYNTHLDHEGAVARACGAAQIVQKIAEDARHFPGKAIVTGDFNDFPDSPCVGIFKQAGLGDATETLPGTYHGFGELTGDAVEKIDYIFTDAKFDPAQSELVTGQRPDGMWISDHHSVCAYITID